MSGKRLIEVDFPLRAVSEESVREKSTGHGHISTLHPLLPWISHWVISASFLSLLKKKQADNDPVGSGFTYLFCYVYRAVTFNYRTRHYCN